MNFRYAIVMTDTDGQELVISHHKSLERAEAQLAWLGYNLEHHITSATNGKSYVRLEVSEMRQADKWGNTHTVTVDTWKPKQGDATDHQDAFSRHQNQDDLPF